MDFNSWSTTEQHHFVDIDTLLKPTLAGTMTTWNVDFVTGLVSGPARTVRSRVTGRLAPFR
ncbi:hypothetical protein [Novipirellula artificiosorum]|uniref:Uncharacterized protein n=1 Tax=Novipirellula artificiosorum TaxID=2528016 RepID=A0A5C6CJT0_9BACT|nr:hypothetical protein [Novipirellula artificiosorum]TWU23847.1 hypothetical protein Poly41_70980 [Novipirellula artificiosorum]